MKGSRAARKGVIPPDHRYPLAIDTFGEEEIRVAKEVLDSRHLTMGEYVARFEKTFADWVGAKNAVMVNSGSSANLLIAEVMLRRSVDGGLLRPGDEVVVPSLTWPTTLWPLVQLGLVPVLADIERSTLALDLESVKSVQGPRTKGICVIPVLGNSPTMADYVEFCRRNNLVLLEDACESLGSHSRQKHVGTHGLMGSFSFYFSHHLSTIEGGMVVTDDDAIADDLRSARAHGWIRERKDRATWKKAFPAIDDRWLFVTAGYNVRPTELHAAIGLVQLAKLEQALNVRETIARQVNGLLQSHAPWLSLVGSAKLRTPPFFGDRRSREHSWMALPMMLSPDSPVTIERLRDAFESNGVETRPIIGGNFAHHPATQRLKIRCASSLAVSDEVMGRGLMIGCHPAIQPAAMETLESAIRSLGRL